MLFEYFQYLRNPGNPFARKLGYSKELVAIDARFRRHKVHWRPHLENSHKVIKKSCEGIENPHAVMVLGAGLIYDIPLDFLCQKFQQVFLVDITFSKKTKQIRHNYSNLHIITHDLNGLETQYHNLEQLPTVHADLPAIHPKPDLVISANILSQLHLAPINYWEKTPNCDDSALIDFAGSIISGHIELLKAQECKVCLITDYIRFTQNGDHIEQESALLGVELPEPDISWRWEIAPKGELGKGKSMYTTVYGYYNY